MSPVDRSRDCPLQERLQRIRKSSYLMTVFPHWIIRPMALSRKKLNERVKDATVLIVAQRISTILHADKIIVLEEGRIAGIGTHEELLAGCETYQEIAKPQLEAGTERRCPLMAEQNIRRHGPRGPHGGMAPGEKAKDFKGTMKSR